jgi:hypothetical protein
MKLLTVGDSFTYGEELRDITHAWPYKLAKNISAELHNSAMPGSGNTSMVRNVTKHAHNNDLIIIAWSHWARIEFADQYGIYDTWPGHRNITFTGNLSFRGQLLEYITEYHNDEYLYNQHLIQIILLQNYLKSINKKYLMINAFSQPNPVSDASLLDQIDTRYYLGWPNKTMMEWTYRCAQGPRGHFLEDGHRIVAEKINEHIRNLGWVS